MKKNRFFVSVLFVTLLLSVVATASSIEKEIDRIAREVAELKLGLGDYVLGKSLTAEQKKIARQNPIKKSLRGTYKFQDSENFVIAANENDIVLGVYQHYSKSTMVDIKKIIGGLMFEYGEPTATAHDNMIYWTYNDQGKIDQDTFEFQKRNGGTKSLATIKFSSAEPIGGEPQKEAVQTTSAYLMITSDPLSTLFLAQTKQ